ncbi:hypothetical protein [Brachybacterium aquaticum]|uniref:Scaffolding protein n=1 Tax=Brachybacterium aquaticum TaxID=1432564 RepID=A0A841AAJ3_9MICO|nr:hypothetical protein [Brachybacterium aquaticum]MBB5830967.1 hypothetical protein [Brachybacterium aquaticum]
MTLPNEQENTMTDEKHENGPETNENPSEAPEPTEASEEPGDGSESTESDTPAVAKLRREAAGHRAKLREAEAERDAVVVQRDALAAAVLGDALRGTGVNAELFATAGRSIEEFVVDGVLDRAAITSAGREVAKKYGVASPAVSRRTGTGAERPPKEAKTWADALGKR